MKVLTFDIEEWFHILDEPSTKTEKQWENYESRIHLNVDRILELLETKKQKATFFCLGWIAKKYPEVIRKIDDMGYEIATHSNLHQLVYEQTREEFKTDLENSIKLIEDITGKKIRVYRAPGFSIKEENKWAFEVLIENGIEVDCSIFPAERSHGGFPDFGTAEPALIKVNGKYVKEFPINFQHMFGKKLIFSGGGYFRFLPYWYLKRAFGSSSYVMTYFHPRDFDPKQPMIENLPLHRKFKSYYGLKGAFSKLEKLLCSFDFTDVRTAVDTTDWQKAKIMTL
ncbi:MAG: polysaccharide deacetylase [Flavobacteriales bacterium]|nr:MAG: polysaccharide deacetylase [Flavobacteriales bacterium]